MAKVKEINTNTEQKIIEVAKTLFAEKGFHGTSIRDICKVAGVNISLISYYFGGKTELYKVVVDSITKKIINYMRTNILLYGGFAQEVPDFNLIPQAIKVQLFFKILDKMIDYFYSSEISDADIMIIFREQITSGVPLNAEGYKILKSLLASILGRDENDKEVIFKCLTIVGQVHAARTIKQFSLKMMNQSGYSKEDIQMLKQIITSHVKSILKDSGIQIGDFEAE